MLIDLVLVFSGAVFILLGLAMSIIPMSLGPVISFTGVLMLHFSSLGEFSVSFIVAWSIVVVLIFVFEKVFSFKMIEYFGGTFYGERVATFGLLPGVFVFSPWGLIIFPWLLTFLFELYKGNSFKKSLKLSFGSFLRFVVGRGIKLFACLFLGIYFFSEIYEFL